MLTVVIWYDLDLLWAPIFGTLLLAFSHVMSYVNNLLLPSVILCLALLWSTPGVLPGSYVEMYLSRYSKDT
jgi:hypothetical protein